MTILNDRRFEMSTGLNIRKMNLSVLVEQSAKDQCDDKSILIIAIMSFSTDFLITTLV